MPFVWWNEVKPFRRRRRLTLLNTSCEEASSNSLRKKENQRPVRFEFSSAGAQKGERIGQRPFPKLEAGKQKNKTPADPWPASSDAEMAKRLGILQNLAEMASLRPPNPSQESRLPPRLSHRISRTDDPCIVFTKALIAQRPDTLSLAQGVVHWLPPASALSRAVALAGDASVCSYGPDEGLPSLRQRLREKLATENGIEGYDVHVTAGANQAFANLVVALLDAEDRAVLFAPYYFNHHMALTSLCGPESVVLGPCNESFRPDLEWLERHFENCPPLERPRMVVVTNPCNPTGILLTKEELDAVAHITAENDAFLVVDNTYEHFTYDGLIHYAPSGPHIVHVFSFSKAWGMMGWYANHAVSISLSM